MNWLDIVLLLLVLVSTALGSTRGFVRAVFGFVSTFLGLFLGAWTYESMASSFLEHLSSPQTANFLGFLIVFAVVLALGAVFGHLVGRLVSWGGLRWLDHILGGGVGLIRGTLVGAVLVMALCAFARVPPPPSVVSSRMAPFVLETSSWAAAIAPAKLRDRFTPAYTLVKARWTPPTEGKKGDKKGAGKGQQAKANAPSQAGGE